MNRNLICNLAFRTPLDWTLLDQDEDAVRSSEISAMSPSSAKSTSTSTQLSSSSSSTKFSSSVPLKCTEIFNVVFVAKDARVSKLRDVAIGKSIGPGSSSSSGPSSSRSYGSSSSLSYGSTSDVAREPSLSSGSSSSFDAIYEPVSRSGSSSSSSFDSVGSQSFGFGSSSSHSQDSGFADGGVVEYAMMHPPAACSSALIFDVFGELDRKRTLGGLTKFAVRGFTRVRFNDALLDPEKIKTAPDWLLKSVMREVGSPAQRVTLGLKKDLLSSLMAAASKANLHPDFVSVIRFLRDKQLFEELAFDTSFAPFLGCHADLLRLSPSVMRELHDSWIRDPFLLCFPDFCFGMKPVSYDDAFKHDAGAVRDWHLPTLDLYNKLYDGTYKGGNSYILSSAVSSPPTAGMDYLQGLGVLAKMRHYCFQSVFDVEHAISTCIGILAESSSADCLASVAEQDDSKFTFCDEQRLAWDSFKSCPFLIVSGRAGSGKTRFLQALGTGFFGRPLGVTFQGINSAPLQSAFSFGKAMTGHRAIHDHIKEHAVHLQGLDFGDHDGTGMRDRDAHNCDCIFSTADVLVVDEAATMSQSILAHVLSAFVYCSRAKVKRVVLVGDEQQLAAIGMCSAFSQLVCFFRRCRISHAAYVSDEAAAEMNDGADLCSPKTLRSFARLVQFEHNHRSGDDSLACANARAIAEGLYSNIVIRPGVFELVDPSERLIEEVVVDYLRDHPSWKERETVVMTRTHEVRKRLLTRLEAFYAGQDGRFMSESEKYYGLNVGRKFAFGRNFSCQSISTGSVATINNDLMVLEWVGYVDAAEVPDHMLQPEMMPDIGNLMNTASAGQQLRRSGGRKKKRSDRGGVDAAETARVGKRRTTKSRFFRSGSDSSSAVSSRPIDGFMARVDRSPSSSGAGCAREDCATADSDSNGRSLTFSASDANEDFFSLSQATQYSEQNIRDGRSSWLKAGNDKILMIHYSTVRQPKQYRACTWEFAEQVAPKRASAMTVNAAQGSEFQHAIYVIDFVSRFESRRQLYTACTRSRKVMICSKCVTFKRAVETKGEVRLSLLKQHLERTLQVCQ